MGSIIDVRLCVRTGRWHARPRFSYDRNSFEHGPATGEGSCPTNAIYDLSKKMPDDLANAINLHCHRLYRSPEYDWIGDKCFEMDGHCPSKQEWAQRRAKFLMSVDLGNTKEYGLVNNKN